jgi:hypothetical protein
MRFSTGSATADSRDDFARARRHGQWARAASRLLGRPEEVDVLLPFDEVVAALGRRGERRLGLMPIALDTVVGSVDRLRGFDRRFRPTSELSRTRFERIARIVRSGGELPPIDVYRVGGAHFVRDGHHRVAVARAMGWSEIDAYVTEILTEVGASRDLTVADLPLKGHERLFWERVPLPRPDRGAIALSDPWDYGDLAEAVEAWGFRHMQAVGEFLSRRATAEAWFADEFVPAVRLLRDTGLHPGGSDAEAYLRLSTERYRLLRSHEWAPDVIERLRREHGADDDPRRL